MVKIVITGGTFAGKSTLVKELSIQGFKVFFDQGFVVIDELNSKIGLEKQKLFRNDKPQLFYQKIIDKQVEIEKNINGSDIVIFDRGILDYIIMAELFNNITITCDFNYDLVFVLEILDTFDIRESSGRSLNIEQSNHLCEEVRNRYSIAGCKVINVAQMPLKERVEFVKDKINDFLKV